ncbi:MAG: polysaccharide deacetylase family protein [Ignavibacteriales bacterium]|nr:polysaccharide deacetylase family protein [Ignavibacteriales bacterium]
MITHTGSIHRVLFPSLLWRMPSQKIFLTFDDGPHSAATHSVLDMCKRHNVRATFFLTGKNIPGNESIVRRIVDEGHSIGIHAYHHTRALAFSKERTKEEIIQTVQLLAPLTRQKIRLFRPPFGFFSWNTIAAARELDFVLVMWSCLTGDFRNWTDTKIVSIATTKLKKGAILVFHDNDLTAHKITNVLDKTIVEIKKLGFEFGAIR